jgi:hypothetical protein
MNERQAYIKFYPCEHTLRDGLHYSQSSCQVTGQWVVASGIEGIEIGMKGCAQCAQWNEEDEGVSDVL